MRDTRREAASRFASLACTLVAAAALLVHATPATAQGLAVGIEGGPTFSDMSVEDGSVDFDSRSGFRVAGVVRYGFGGSLGIESGVGLAQKGATAPPAETGLQQDLEFNLSYIELPLFLTAAIPTPGYPVTPRIFAGPQVSFESSCEIAATGDGVSTTVDCAAEELGESGLNTESTSFGLVFGGGLDFELGGPLSVTVDGRYDLGLSDINDVTDPDAAEITNRSFAVSGGLLLTLP